MTQWNDCKDYTPLLCLSYKISYPRCEARSDTIRVNFHARPSLRSILWAGKAPCRWVEVHQSEEQVPTPIPKGPLRVRQGQKLQICNKGHPRRDLPKGKQTANFLQPKAEHATQSCHLHLHCFIMGRNTDHVFFPSSLTTTCLNALSVMTLASTKGNELLAERGKLQQKKLQIITHSNRRRIRYKAFGDWRGSISHVQHRRAGKNEGDVSGAMTHWEGFPECRYLSPCLTLPYLATYRE